MEAGNWHLAEAQLALMLAASEQAAMREWRWSPAWLLTHMAEPPWQQIGRIPQKDAARPLSRLADQSWMAICISYVKD
eukprot:7573692-Heterocapsa_arctica.AAC.1